MPRSLHSQRTARMMARLSAMLWPAAIPTPRSSFHHGQLRFRMRLQRRSAIGILRQSKSMDAWAGSAALATIVGAWLRLRCIVQDHHWSATLGPDSAQAADRGTDRMRRAQPDDEFRHAGLRSDPLMLDAVGRCRRRPVHAPKRFFGTIRRANGANRA